MQEIAAPQRPEMYVKERDRFDINQGEIGDCWFLAALANLADDDEAFNKVVPTGQGFGPGYCGIFRFRFFRFGSWVEVVVDDRLPTRNGNLIYLKSKEKNEFWSPLLEKAYAKLYGSYKALEGGLTIEAAVDFTGGIPEMIDTSRHQSDCAALFYNMLKAYENQAFMSCSLSVSDVIAIFTSLDIFSPELSLSVRGGETGSAGETRLHHHQAGGGEGRSR